MILIFKGEVSVIPEIFNRESQHLETPDIAWR